MGLFAQSQLMKHRKHYVFCDFTFWGTISTWYLNLGFRFWDFWRQPDLANWLFCMNWAQPVSHAISKTPAHEFPRYLQDSAHVIAKIADALLGHDAKRLHV